MGKDESLHSSHNVETVKLLINEMSSHMSDTMRLELFERDGSLFGLCGHKVTVDEVNKQLVIPLQNKLKGLASDVKRLSDICSQTYGALEWLSRNHLVDDPSEATRQAKEAQLSRLNEIASSKTAVAGSDSAKCIRDLAEICRKTYESLESLDKDYLPDNFEAIRQTLDQLSCNIPSVDLRLFETTESSYPINDRKVTGGELNERLIGPLQSILGSLTADVKNLFDICLLLCNVLDDMGKDYSDSHCLANRQAIEQYSRRVSGDIQLDLFETEDQFLGLCNHRVMGYEINRQLVKPLQCKLDGLTADIMHLFEIFRLIYEALATLDERLIAKAKLCG